MAIMSLPLIGGRLKQWLGGDASKAFILKAAGGNFAIAVAGTGLAFISNMFLARWMGAANFGAYTYALGWINTLSLITTLGRTSTVVRFVPTYVAQREFGRLHGLLRESFLYVALAGVILAVAAAAILPLLRARLQPGVYEVLLVGTCALLPFLGLIALGRQALRGLQHVQKAPLAETIIRPLGTLIFAFSLLLVGSGHLTAFQAMLASIASAVTAFAASAFWLRRALPQEMSAHPAHYETRYWNSVSLPLLLNAFLTYILSVADILILGMLSSTEVVGVYAVASRVAGLAMFSVVAVGNILAPMIAEQHAMKNTARMQRVVTQAAWISAATTLVIILGLVVLGPWLFSLFGPGFSDAYVPLLILLAGHFVNSLCGNAGFLMTMTGHHVQTLRILGSAAILHVLLSLVMIPRWGANGAAIATAVCEAFWTIAIVVYVRKNLKVNPTIFGRMRT